MSEKIKYSLTLCVCVLLAGIMDFAVATLFQDFLHVPLFFDTIFLIAVLFSFGPLASFIVYVINISIVCLKLELLYGKTDYVWVYSLSAFVIILITWLFIRKEENLKKGVNHTFIYILTASVSAALVCSVVSGFISYFTFRMNVGNWTFDKLIFAFSGEYMDVLTSCIVGRFPIIILDRIITTFAGFGIHLLFIAFAKKHRLLKETF
ncbi:hypothetical protein MSI_10830 [Treponema sp. JC4]|uniref:hypothetical protein n=1 Tax=Treponema sp. JC4 TaxID=1124982 RepID=UPI00025B0DD2|nr:hypothetical protein [Treponema sp. JC4]EID85365.1 hypothetical protein MSI_10830 [Treponema sp. JC4]